MSERDPICAARNRFEAYLKKEPRFRAGYRKYNQVKKEALREGEDPMHRFRDLVARTLGSAEARKFWLMALGKRLVEPEEDDIDLVIKGLALKGVDFVKLVNALLEDRKRIAEVIRAFNIDKFKDADIYSIYMIVDKVITTKGGKKGKPIPGQFFFDDIPDDTISESSNGFELLRKYGIEQAQVMFDEDFDKARKMLRDKIDGCKEPVKKALYKEIDDFYEGLRTMEIPGIIDRFFDQETGETAAFPSSHQKMGARFIADEMRVLIADEPGLGKTAQAVIAKNIIDKREGRRLTAVAVVPPGRVFNQWREQVAMWNTKRTVVIPAISQKGRRAKAKAEYLIRKEDGSVESVPITSDKELEGIRSNRGDYIIVVPVSSQTKAKAFEELDGKDKPDFIIVPYTMVYQRINGGTVGDHLSEVCDYLIIDEVHNAKRQDSERKRAARSHEAIKLSKVSKFVALLSGTPLPNRIFDVGVIASILSNHEITPQEFNRRYRKTNLAEFQNRVYPKMRRTLKKGSSFSKSRSEPQRIMIQMTKEQKVKHDELRLNPDNLEALELIMNLRKCALDPRLVGIDQDSPKYRKLCEMIVDNYLFSAGSAEELFSSLEERGSRVDPGRFRLDIGEGESASIADEEGNAFIVRKKGGRLEVCAGGFDRSPVVVFSSELKRGVLGKVCRELEQYGLRVARVDGDAKRSGANRERILKEFQEGGYDVLVATATTMGEGVDALKVAHRGYLLDMPFNDAKLQQMMTRLDRKGQKRKVVDFYMLICEGSIDERLCKLIEQKAKLSMYLIDGVELTDPEKKLLEEKGENLVTSDIDHLRSLYDLFGNYTDVYTKDVVERLSDGTVGMLIAKYYWENFEGSFYGNTMNLVSDMIRRIEKRKGIYESVLDLASGPCCLARALGRPIVSLDANAAALEHGKSMLGEKAGECVAASFTDLPLRSKGFDLVVFSLALLHSRPEEREGILREVNRIMELGGTLILTLPSGDGKYDGKLPKALRMLGYRIHEHLSGTARADKQEGFECTIYTAEKVSEPTVGHVPVELLDFHIDRMRSEHTEASVSRTIKRRVCTSFKIDEETIESALKRSDIRKRPEERLEKGNKDRRDGKKGKMARSAPAQKGPAERPKGEKVIYRIMPEVRVREYADAPAPPKQEPEGKIADPAQYLIDKYGDVKGVHENCPREVIEQLGLEFYTHGRKNSVLGLRVKNGIPEGLKDKHKEFVKGRKPAPEDKGGNGRLSA